MRLKGWGGAAAVAGVALVAGVLYAAVRPAPGTGPAVRPNPAGRSLEMKRVGRTLHVVTREPAEILVVDSAMPRGRARLLWFGGRGTAWTPDGGVTLDGSGQPVRFDERLRAERLRFWLEGRQAASVAWDGSDGYWVATREGSVLRVGWDGAIGDSVAPPFDYSFLASDEAGHVWAVRSPEQFSFPFGRPVAPLVVPVGRSDLLAIPARAPAVPIFVHLVNAGRVAVGADGSIYYAPFIRDEIVKFTPAGDTAWVASRGLPHGTAEPAFEVEDGRPLLDYAPVNLGLAFGPDGMLYVLSTPGHSTVTARLDVIDPDSGIVRRTAHFQTALPTIAVGLGGRVHLLDEFRLLTGVAPHQREALVPFDLERLGGGRAALADYRGKVLLVNFWASWCAPCRVEMPALDSLQRSFPPEEFAFLAISDDMNDADARAFIEEFRFTLPVAFGRGKMKAQYHYFGLPYTVLVDREGRIVERWSGFAGDRQVEAIGSLVRAEVARLSPVISQAGHGEVHKEQHSTH